MERTKEALQVLESKITGEAAPERQTKADYIEEIAKNYTPGGGSAVQNLAHIIISDSYIGGYTLVLDTQNITTYDDLVNYLIEKRIFANCNGLAGDMPDRYSIPVYSVASTGYQYTADLNNSCTGFTVLKGYGYLDPDDQTVVKKGNVLAITDGIDVKPLLKEDVNSFEVTYLAG